jgi:hypothetical protein
VHKNETPQSLFFPCEHARTLSLPLTARTDILSLTHLWQQHFLSETLPSLDYAISVYRERKQDRNDVLSRHSALRAEKEKLSQEQDIERERLRQYLTKGSTLGLDFSSLLKKFPGHWVTERMKPMTDSNAAINSSIFFSPERQLEKTKQTSYNESNQLHDDVRFVQGKFKSEQQSSLVDEKDNWTAESHAMSEEDLDKHLEPDTIIPEIMTEGPEVNFDVIESLASCLSDKSSNINVRYRGEQDFFSSL